MAGSISFEVFYQFLLFAVLLGSVNKSYCHKATDIFHYSEEDPSSDVLLCRQCGADLADSGYIISRLSDEALVVLNRTLFNRKGVLIQFLENAAGLTFSTISLSAVNCTGIDDEWRPEFDWFPGYAWKPCMCSQCGEHLGWMYEPVKTATSDRHIPSSKGFYILILDKIVSADFSSSLIVIPKVYAN